jgi:hypothetical protein
MLNFWRHSYFYLLIFYLQLVDLLSAESFEGVVLYQNRVVDSILFFTKLIMNFLVKLAT